MNAGVGPPAAGDPHWLGGDPLQRLLNAALHSRFLALDLPSEEHAAVVFQADRVSHDYRALKKRKAAAAPRPLAQSPLQGPDRFSYDQDSTSSILRASAC
jgi:hypothetical protein